MLIIIIDQGNLGVGLLNTYSLMVQYSDRLIPARYFYDYYPPYNKILFNLSWFVKIGSQANAMY